MTVEVQPSAPTGQAQGNTAPITEPAAAGGGEGVATPAAPAPAAPVEGGADKGGTIKPEGGVEPSQPAALEIKLPDGLEVDAASLEWFKGAATELGLNSETASKLVTMNAERAKADNEKVQAIWADELKKDPEFGGDKLAATVLDAKRALRKFGGEEFAATMEAAGFSNHPDMVRTFTRIGRAMHEDSSDTGGGARGSGPVSEYDRQKALYPNSPELWGKS